MIQDAETTAQESQSATRRRRSAAARKSPARKAKARKTARRRSTVSRAITPSNRVLKQGKRVVSRAYSLADEARRAVPRLTRGFHLPRPRDLDVLSDANPLVVGAIGLGIGVLLGGLMPYRFGATGSASSGGRGRKRG